MKTAKMILEILLISILATLTVLGVFSVGATSDDPADNYRKQTAPYEDSGINLWFDYSFRKNLTSDKTSTGMDTFSIYMAKNEIESAQFLLYSETDRTNLTAEVTDFTDGKGHSVPADVYYEMYVTVSELNTRTVLGTNQIIREGEVPDPVFDVERLGTPKNHGHFKLNGGKSQAFLIRAKSSEDTPAGWYSAQLNIKNSDGQIIKTATVYCHVWDFVISDETRMQTAFFMSSNFEYGGNYKTAYDYLLENRLCAMDIPTEKYGEPFNSTNPYLTNPRVSAIRVTSNGGGNAGHYSDITSGEMTNYSDIYNELASSPVWEKIKDKLYFYSVDEPLPYPLVGSKRQTVDDGKYINSLVRARWGDDPRFVVTPCENFPYSEKDSYYTKPMTQYSQEQIKDADQEMIDSDMISIFCPRIYAFTPYSELQTYFSSIGRDNCLSIENYHCIRGESITQYSGVYGNYGSANISVPFDWNLMYGDTFDRYMSHIINSNNKGTYNTDYEMWMYSAGYNKSYTYVNHVVENTGLQTKLMFWQAYQNDVTGYLYYAVSAWNEQTNPEYDKTVTGSKTGYWPLNEYTIQVPNYEKGIYETKNVYGGGVLFYGPAGSAVIGGDMVGSVRVELLRDSVEEYQMLSMLGDLKGKDRAKEIVSQVSSNVVRYLSLSGFDRSAWSSSMDEYDIMETVRRGLGNELEAAVKNGECGHTWNAGTVTKAETCTAMGEILYTCTKCGAERTEYIPTKHEVGNCFDKISGTEPTCTENGNAVYRCKLCGFKKTVIKPNYHSAESEYQYVSKGERGHSVSCKHCGSAISSLNSHVMFIRKSEPTCTEAGGTANKCKYCDYAETVTVVEALGHSYSEGYCTVCGEKDPDYKTYTPGDLNSDGKINAADVTLLKKIIVGKMERVDAADVNGDTKVTSSDVVLLKKKIVGKA